MGSLGMYHGDQQNGILNMKVWLKDSWIFVSPYGIHKFNIFDNEISGHWETGGDDFPPKMVLEPNFKTSIYKQCKR